MENIQTDENLYVNDNCIKKCISQDQIVNKEALKIISAATQILIEELLEQAAFEVYRKISNEKTCIENKELEVKVEDLDRIWPYVLLHY